MKYSRFYDNFHTNQRDTKMNTARTSPNSTVRYLSVFRICTSVASGQILLPPCPSLPPFGVGLPNERPYVEVARAGGRVLMAQVTSKHHRRRLELSDYFFWTDGFGLGHSRQFLNGTNSLLIVPSSLVAWLSGTTHGLGAISQEGVCAINQNLLADQVTREWLFDLGFFRDLDLVA